MEFVIIGVLVALGLVIGIRSLGRNPFKIGAVWGTTCPRCGTRLPMIRRPASVEEELYGGWTCSQCGCKVDRFGKERPPA